MGAKTDAEPRKVTLGLVSSWIFGVLFMLGGLGNLFTQPLAGILLLVAGLVLFPPVRRFVQKKFAFELSTGLRVTIVLVLMVLAGMSVSPGSATPSPVTGPQRSTASAAGSGQPAAHVVRLGEPVPAGDFTWTFISVDRRSIVGEYIGETLLGKEASGVFLVVDVTVENTGTRASYLTASMVTLVDDRGREFSPDTAAGFYLKGEGLTFDQVNPGLVKKGTLVFDVPKDIRVARVRINSGLLSTDTYYVDLLQ